MGQFRLRDLVANPLDLYPRPVSLEGADVDFQLKLDPFRLEIGQLRISDQGKTLLVDGEATATPDGWTLAIDGQMDALAPDRLLALWPQRVGTGLDARFSWQRGTRRSGVCWERGLTPNAP